MFLVFLFLYSDSQPEAFTGRGLIWNTLLNIINESNFEILGYGALYGASDIINISDFANYQSFWLSNIASGHNGYLDIIVTTGSFGFLLSLLVYFVLPLYKISINKNLIVKNFQLTLLFFFIFFNFFESSFLDRAKLISTFYVFFVVSLYGDD
jgi:O-antigen ligase